jgi:hypothetical protein
MTPSGWEIRALLISMTILFPIEDESSGDGGNGEVRGSPGQGNRDSRCFLLGQGAGMERSVSAETTERKGGGGADGSVAGDGDGTGSGDDDGCVLVEHEPIERLSGGVYLIVVSQTGTAKVGVFFGVIADPRIDGRGR